MRLIHPASGFHADIIAGDGDLAAVVLAAGAGTRLRPLTHLLPKALCPVNNVPLVDLAIERARTVTETIAVNVHHGRPLLEPHLRHHGVHVSVEEPHALGTAGALGHLRRWIDGRHVLVINVDSWLRADLPGLVEGWDGSRPRLLAVRDENLATWDGLAYTGIGLLPWEGVSRLSAAVGGLWEAWWKALVPGTDLELIEHPGPFFDCGTPAGYLAANLEASGGKSVIGEGAVVEGSVERSVVWPGARVWPGERLYEVIRAGESLTVPGS